MDLDILKERLFFMPDATRGAVRYLTTRQLEETGTKAIVTNTLHLMMSPGKEVIERLGGIKRMMGWEGIVFTDSGGFQVFSLIHSGRWDGEVGSDGARFRSPVDGRVFELSPESSIDMQMSIGSDVLVCLDDCRDAGVSRGEASESVDRSVAWAKRCRDHFDRVYGGSAKSGKLLTAVVQGGSFLDLRERCARELVDIGFDGYNFGGFVVDSEGRLVVDELAAVIESVPSDGMRYAMGVGKPEDIRVAARMGYNLFDTVLVTRNARHGTLYTSEGEIRIGNSEMGLDDSPVDKRCSCECCANYTRAYLHHMMKNREAVALTLATIHNLTYYQTLISGLS
ncbi:MAG: tRNA guanosine(34) transglycosylase Tgt [Candidatus Dojkabacteria bacterium]|jgi:queuine tRNA-ribosyltransferase